MLASAAAWLGTPFVDCASVRGAGVDCAMFVKAAFEGAGLEPPFTVPSYSPQWYLNGNQELWLPLLEGRAVEIEQKDLKPADLVLYKFGTRFFSHGALVDSKGWPNIIHAYRQTRMVTRDLGNQGLLARCAQKYFTHKAWVT